MKTNIKPSKVIADLSQIVSLSTQDKFNLDALDGLFKEKKCWISSSDIYYKLNFDFTCFYFKKQTGTYDGWEWGDNRLSNPNITKDEYSKIIAEYRASNMPEDMISNLEKDMESRFN